MSICDWKPLMDWTLIEENFIPSNTKDKYFWQNVIIFHILLKCYNFNMFK